jgi:hypothetical protein
MKMPRVFVPVITPGTATQVHQEGKRNVKREVLHYNLDAILSVGYRVNSKRGTQFRQWATQHLKDYLVQGYAMNQKRLEELQQTTQLISNGSNTKTFLPKNLLFHRQPFLTANC